ncbi:uncharacterized protein [Ptychodera flava]|uniref:uncharacterized protein n=1 Tax=Ptychodera flava TaxID=63121 RepID=UPI00396AA411
MYGVTNNLFLYTMNVTPPPLWNTLIQTRVIMTVVIYRIVFKKGTTPMRGLAMFILILGITLAALSGSSTGRSVQEPTMRIVIRAVVLSLVSSALSSAASVYTEYLYKKNNGPSMQHQVQMYLFSVGMTTVWSLYITKGHPFAIHGRVSIGRILLIFATVILCSVGSLLLPAIVKKMDSIVKVYSSVATIVLMAFLCTWLFPKSFQLNLPYLAAILIILASSVMYERAKPKDASSEKLVTLSSGDALSLDPEKIL